MKVKVKKTKQAKLFQTSKYKNMLIKIDIKVIFKYMKRFWFMMNTNIKPMVEEIKTRVELEILTKYELLILWIKFFFDTINVMFYLDKIVIDLLYFFN